MTDITDHPLPTKSELLRATGIAVVVAIVILVTTILPAEYGLDPIGVGSSLGLSQLNVTSVDTEGPIPDAQDMPLAGVALTRASTNLRQDYFLICDASHRRNIHKESLHAFGNILQLFVSIHN